MSVPVEKSGPDPEGPPVLALKEEADPSPRLIAEVKTNTTTGKVEWIKVLKATEKYDPEYVAAVAAASASKETQETIRQYQWAVTALKIIARVVVAINIYNLLQKAEVLIPLWPF